MAFDFCRLVTEEEKIFSLRTLTYEIKSCLTLGFPKRVFCLPNKADVLCRQGKKKGEEKLGQMSWKRNGKSRMLSKLS